MIFKRKKKRVGERIQYILSSFLTNMSVEKQIKRTDRFSLNVPNLQLPESIQNMEKMERK